MSKSSRKRYQAKRRAYKREEPIDRRNVYGLPDPTPKAAVDKIIQKERRIKT